MDVICSLFFLCVFFNEDLPAVSEQLCMPPCFFLLSLGSLDHVSWTPYFRRGFTLKFKSTSHRCWAEGRDTTCKTLQEWKQAPGFSFWSLLIFVIMWQAGVTGMTGVTGLQTKCPRSQERVYFSLSVRSFPLFGFQTCKRMVNKLDRCADCTISRLINFLKMSVVPLLDYQTSSFINIWGVVGRPTRLKMKSCFHSMINTV